MPIVIGIVVALLAVLFVGCTLLGGDVDTSDDADDAEVVESESESEADDATAATATYYFDSDATVVVSTTTIIVFKNDDGEVIEDFEAVLLSDDGTEATWASVEGSDLVPAEHDVEPGTYSLAVLDPSTNEVYTVPSIMVEEAADSETDAAEAETVVFEPSASGTDSGSGDATRRTLYALYLSKVLEYEGLYGFAATNAYTGGSTELTYISGVALYLLVDFDGDGLEELLLVYEPAADVATFREEVGGYAVDVWAWDEAANDIALASSTYLTEAQDYGTYLTVYEASEGAATWFGGSYYDPEQEDVGLIYEVTYLWGDGDGSHALVSAMDYDDLDPVSLGSTLDGAETTSDEFSDAYGAFSEALAAATSSVTYDLCGIVSSGWCDDLDSTDATREETLQALFRGVVGRDDGETSDEDDSDAAGSAYAAYLGLLEEYQATYGVGAETRVSEDYPSYLTGLCFATLLDMDEDGTEELVLAYCADDDPDYLSMDYVVEVWAWEEGELVRVTQGTGIGTDGGTVRLGLLVSEGDGTGYVVGGSYDDGGELVFTSYADGAAWSVTVAWDPNYDGDEPIYTIDGVEVSYEDFSAWWDGYEYYFLNYYENSASDGGDALAALEETLATLEAAS